MRFNPFKKKYWIDEIRRLPISYSVGKAVDWIADNIWSLSSGVVGAALMRWVINSWGGIPTLNNLENSSLTGLGYALVYLALFVVSVIVFAAVARIAIWLWHAWKKQPVSEHQEPTLKNAQSPFIPLRDAAKQAFNPSVMGDRSGVGEETRIREQITIMRLEALHHPEHLGIYGCVPPSTKITRVPQDYLESRFFALDGSAIGPNVIDDPNRIGWRPLYVRRDDLEQHTMRLRHRGTFGQQLHIPPPATGPSTKHSLILELRESVTRIRSVFEVFPDSQTSHSAFNDERKLRSRFVGFPELSALSEPIFDALVRYVGIASELAPYEPKLKDGKVNFPENRSSGGVGDMLRERQQAHTALMEATHRALLQTAEMCGDGNA